MEAIGGITAVFSLIETAIKAGKAAKKAAKAPEEVNELVSLSVQELWKSTTWSEC